MLLSAGVVPAHDAAAMPAAPASIQVRSDDLDFSHAPDAQVMLDRIAAAAEKACGGTPDYREHRRLEVFDRCRRATISHAVDRLDEPMVTKLAELQPMPMHLVVR
jgi:UrcA family protein